MKLVIAITGMPGSGKSTAVDVLKSEGLRFVRMGDAVRKEMTEKGIEINNVSLRKYVLKIRKISRYYVLNLVKKEIDDAFRTSDLVILDGVRNVGEIERLKKDGYHPVSIAIMTDKQIRFERIKKRHNSSDVTEFSEFEWRETQELKYGIAEVIATSDYYILNNYGIEEFSDKLKSILNTVRKQVKNL